MLQKVFFNWSTDQPSANVFIVVYSLAQFTAVLLPATLLSVIVVGIVGVVVGVGIVDNS